MIDFRAIVREAMERRGLNMHTLSKAAGVPYRAVHNFLADGREIQSDGLGKLCETLGVKVTLPRTRKADG